APFPRRKWHCESFRVDCASKLSMRTTLSTTDPDPLQMPILPRLILSVALGLFPVHVRAGSAAAKLLHGADKGAEDFHAPRRLGRLELHAPVDAVGDQADRGNGRGLTGLRFRRGGAGVGKAVTGRRNLQDIRLGVPMIGHVAGI